MAKGRKARGGRGKGRGKGRGGSKSAESEDSGGGGGGGGLMMRMRGGMESAAGTGPGSEKPASKLSDVVSWAVTAALAAAALYFLAHRIGWIGDDRTPLPVATAVMTGAVGPTAMPATAASTAAPVVVPPAPSGAATAVPGLPPPATP